MEEDYSLYEYVKDNLIGLLLLFIAFIIIYVVDHISQLNNVIFSIPSPLPIPTNSIILNYKKLKHKKYKK